MRKTFATGILLVLVLAVAWLLVPVPGRDRSDPPPTSSVTSPESRARLHIGSTILNVEVADTLRARARGLSGRRALAEDTGMLFTFSSPAPQTFWMKDTFIPLDLIWIRESRVVGITRDVQPEPGTPDAQLRRYLSPGPVDHVLEVNAGWTEQHGVSVGDPLHADLVG